MVLIGLRPQVGTLVTDIVRGKQPIFGYLNLIAESPLLGIGRARIQWEVDVNSAGRESLILRRGKCSGERISAWIPGVWGGKSTRRAGNGNLITPRRSVGVLRIEKRIRPIVKDPVRSADALLS